MRKAKDREGQGPEPQRSSSLEEMLEGLLDERRAEVRRRLTPDQVALLPDYPYAVDRLRQPDQGTFATRYFLRRWAPLLGPTGTVVVLTMRDLVHERGQRAEGDAGSVIVAREEICRACHVGLSTLKKLLANPVFNVFVQPIERRKRDELRGISQQDFNEYRVLMTDPLTTHDQEILTTEMVDAVLQKELGLLLRGGLPAAGDAPGMPAQKRPQTAAFLEPLAEVKNEPQTAAAFGPAFRDGGHRAIVDRTRAEMEPHAPAAPVEPAFQPRQADEGDRVTLNVKNDRTNSVTEAPVKGGELVWWVERMETLTGDYHSTKFFRRAVRILLAAGAGNILDRAYGEVKEAVAAGVARKPGALATLKLRQYAREQGIALTDQDRPEADERSQIRSEIERSLGTTGR